METLIDVLEVVSCVFLLFTLVFVIWRIWASLDTLPATVSKIVKGEVQTRAKSLSSDFLARLEKPVSDLQGAIANLCEFQKTSTNYAVLEDSLSDCRKKYAEQASQLERELVKIRELEYEKAMAESKSLAAASKPASDQMTPPDHVAQEPEA